MGTLITHHDVEHMKAFPAEQKRRILQNIMSREPVAERNFEGNTHCVKTILKLRADGLRLIDFQPLENAFTSIWYKRNGSLLARSKAQVAAMVVWQYGERDDDVTTVMIWSVVRAMRRSVFARIADLASHRSPAPTARVRRGWCPRRRRRAASPAMR